MNNVIHVNFGKKEIVPKIKNPSFNNTMSQIPCLDPEEYEKQRKAAPPVIKKAEEAEEVTADLYSPLNIFGIFLLSILVVATSYFFYESL